MKTINKRRKSQAINEYIVVAACLIAVLVVMQAYVRRGLAGKIKSVVDSSTGEQFDPYKGTYKNVFYQRGDTVTATVTEQQRIQNGSGEDEIAWYTKTYTASGPNEVAIESSDGSGSEIIIPYDESRKPMVSTTASSSEMRWEDFSLEEEE